MSGELLLYIGSGVITLWGVAHIFPTASVVRGFGELSEDNRHIITMEWVAEGLTLVFIGLLVLLLTVLHGGGNPVCVTVYRVSAGMLAAMALLSFFTGFRTSIVPIKICPFVKLTTAALFLVGSMG